VEAPGVIDWQSDETHLLLNPRLPEEDLRRLERLAAEAPPLPAHVLLATSGTTGALKLTALSKRALLASAAAVNRHLESTVADVWCCVLPAFHVGGLGIHARAFLSGARVVEAGWDPYGFAALVAAEGVTLSSLVPAQVRDLLQAGLSGPPSLRAIVIGGGAFSNELYAEAVAAGWPVLPSYGMTECCSQVATARPGSPDLIVLDHMEVEERFLRPPLCLCVSVVNTNELRSVERDHSQEATLCDARHAGGQHRGTEAQRGTKESLLAFRGESLLTGYITEDGFHDPKVDGWLLTEDRGTVDGRTLRIHGRSGDFLKIGGESVDLARLDQILMSIAGLDAAVVAVPDARLGHVIHLAIASEDGARIAAEYDTRVLPFERARAVHRVAAIPRTPLGKLMRQKLLNELPKLVE
jgi:O-succinylbenzoic acid--CoA ligase